MSMRDRGTRFEVHLHENRMYIDDDDFGWDAMLRIGGDFGTEAEKLAFARAVAKALNEAGDAIPTRDSYEHNTGAAK